jgi:broad specificity phosphatase PhoE
MWHDTQARKVTDEGRALCGQAAKGWFKEDVNGKAKFAVCSPAKRCHETCKAMSERLGKMPVVKEVWGSCPM